ncbi:hypothetical protein [Natronobacterium gregoryi]|uniref:Uncharacterized protein n=1 Tax=Natronobacterium gregoryi (strain ATCC 43098 / DSM 3393 / CCM 3738 / CIP 104747 / IAM 13177 / JCM 8860 / NBRC 102187 / NCIMB 2189 / SP2) TaxID=797304 RepID=L9Y5S6_NATGS|nr:hypothetical protein C490_08346 [Natronobacterium gregoryi SP2]
MTEDGSSLADGDTRRLEVCLEQVGSRSPDTLRFGTPEYRLGSAVRERERTRQTVQQSVSLEDGHRFRRPFDD